MLCNAVQCSSVTSPSPGYDIPYDGVITRWTVKTGTTVNNAPEWARPRTFRRTSATTATLISQGAQGSLTTPSNQPVFWDRIPATAGDVLGAQFHSGALISETVPTYIDNTAAGDVAARNFESPGPDIGGTTTGPGYANQRVNISARFEHDTDHDGYGDGSQDLCTGDPARATTACSGTLFGSDLQGPYQRIGYTCSGIGYACVRVQLTTAAGTSTAAPTDGVVVRWRLQGPGAGDYRIRILNPKAGGGYTFARSSDPATVGADEALQTYATRLPIAVGGYVALTPPFSVPESTQVTPPAGSSFATIADSPDGSAATIAGSLPGVFLYDADIEPDADHDGYGDVTQDACPADATTQGACPPVGTAPGTGGGPTTAGTTPVKTVAAGRITALQLRYTRFRILPRGAVLAARPHAGTALLVTLSAPARVRFTVRRLAGGVQRGGGCRPPHRQDAEAAALHASRPRPRVHACTGGGQDLDGLLRPLPERRSHAHVATGPLPARGSGPVGRGARRRGDDAQLHPGALSCAGVARLGFACVRPRLREESCVVRAKLLVLALTVTAIVASAPAAHAATHVVTFDDLPAGTTVTNQYLVADGVEFTQPSDPGDAPFVQDGAGQAHSGTQVANFDTDPCCGENFDPRFTRGELNTTASSVSVEAGYIGAAGATSSIQLVGYNASNAVVGTSALVTVSGAAPMTHLQVNSAATDIKYFDVKQAYTFNEASGHHVAFDDLTIVTADAPQPPDFTLTSGTGVLDVLQGQSLNDPIRVNRVNGSSGDIAMSVSGLPTGMTGTFSPNPVPGDTGLTTLTLTAAPLAAPAVDYSNVTITGTPTAGAGPAPRTITAIARISQNCTNTVRFDYVDLRDAGCLRKTGANAYYALNTEVHINGLVLTPRDGDHVLTVDPVARTIKSDLGATFSVTIAGHPNEPFYYGPIDWSFTTDSTTPVPLDKDPVGKPKEVVGIDISGNPFLQGIPLTGVKVVFTASGKAVVTPTLTLDFFPFDEIGAGGISASASFTSDNDHGADFSGFEIKIPDLNVKALELKDVDIRYVNSGTFSGSAKVVLAFDDKLTVGAGYGIKNGDFDFLKGSVSNINTLIGEGVYLQGLGFEVDTHPTTLKGQIELSAGPAVAGRTALSFDGGVTAVLADPWILEVDGDAKLGGKYELASAFLRYSSFGLFEFGGQVNWKFSPLYFNGAVTGWVAGAHNFDVEGSVHGCVDVPYLPTRAPGRRRSSRTSASPHASRRSATASARAPPGAETSTRSPAAT